MKYLTSLLMLAIAFLSSTASAQLVTEDFSYPDGSFLALQPGWDRHSGSSDAVTGDPINDFLVNGGQAVVQHGVPAEDVNLAFADVTTGTLTANFDITVNDDEIIAGADSEYFAHFFEEGTFRFRARLSVVPPTGAGDYSLGISSTSSTEDAILTNDFNFGDTVAVELSLDVDTGVASLTVNGETITGAAGNTGETMNRFALRQSDSSNNETVTIDNLVVTDGTTSAPLKGDVDLSGVVDFADIPAFIAVLQAGGFQAEADCDCSGMVDFSDIPAFIAILQGG
jgi:hypothetical protein